jgi:hypothetical protein
MLHSSLHPHDVVTVRLGENGPDSGVLAIHNVSMGVLVVLSVALENVEGFTGIMIPGLSPVDSQKARKRAQAGR